MADPGTKMRESPDHSYQRDVAPGQGQVVKFGLDGVEVARLARPAHGAYESGFFAPTSVAVNETRHGGNGDVWVADGYGESLVHRYGADGRYLSTLTGEEGPSWSLQLPPWCVHRPSSFNSRIVGGRSRKRAGTGVRHRRPLVAGGRRRVFEQPERICH